MAPCDQASWAEVLDVPADIVLGEELIGPVESAGKRPDLGVIKPIRGGCFALLSTGIADYGLPGSRTPEPGTDLGTQNSPDGDKVTIHLKVHVPAGADHMTLQYNFLSTESPDFNTGQDNPFNDTFSIQLIDDHGVSSCTPGGAPSCDVATVNNSHFFDVSESRARGTGFDLFTEDPLGVDDGDFTGGKPDAGMTDFQVYSAKVTGDTDLDLLFTIQDNGDGILDSAVLLDAVEFSSLEMVDPTPQLVNQIGAGIGKLSQSPDDLVSLGLPIRGAVADGTTQVVLRMKVPAAGQVDFSLPDGSALGDGSLSSLGGAEGANAVAGSIIFDASRQAWATAVYTAPANFSRGPDDDGLVERTTQIHAKFTADDQSVVDTSIAFQIRRPPVVLVRGIWTQPGDWYPDFNFQNFRTDTRFLVNNQAFTVSLEDGSYACDPQVQVLPQEATSCSAAGITPVACSPDPGTAMANAVQSALDNTRRLGIAATKVDVVAQGTAGLRARRYIETDSDAVHHYRNPTNYMQGDVNRLITLNTPHFGSLIADQAILARDHPKSTATPDYVCLMRIQRAPVESGNIDLATRAHLTLQETPVPSHAIVGFGGLPLNNDNRTIGLKLLPLRQNAVTLVGGRLRNNAKLYSTAFGLCDHDLFSDVVSQTGDIDPKAVTPIQLTLEPTTPAPTRNSPDSDGFRSMLDPDINAIVESLLNTPPDSTDFAHFPASGAQRCDPATGLETKAPLPAFAPPQPLIAPRDEATGGLRIVSPTPDTVVHAGDVIDVQVVADGDFIPVTVMASAGDTVVQSDVAPFTTQITIPKDALGTVRISAIAYDANDEAVLADIVPITATTTAKAETVRILTQDPILYRTAEQRQLVVFADFDDGFSRDITFAAAGTTYLTSNSDIVTVGKNGLITAVGSGIATVIAQNGQVQDSITVTVKANASPVVKAGGNVTLACAAPGAKLPVQLDASATFDPEADPLTFSWFEDDVKIATGPTPIVALGAGSHKIDLVVTDGISNPATGSVTVAIAEDTAPPVVSVVGDNPASVECRASFSDPGATASDACDGDLTAAIQATSSIDTGAVGSYAVTYQVQDKAGLTGTASRAVAVADHTPPQLSVLGANPAITECGVAFVDDGAAATDVCDGDLTAAITAHPHVNAATVGSYSVDYDVHDRSGNAATASRAVTVADRTPPKLSILGDNPAVAECGVTYRDKGATASDLCSGDLTAAITTVSHVNTATIGTSRVDYSVRDAVGLTATASRSVQVVDRTAPQVSIDPMRTLFPPDDRYRTFDLSDCASAVDACAGPLDIDRAGDIVAIHSDERDSAHFGDPRHDIVILSHSRFAIRDQANSFGNGRVYEIEFTAHDSRGNTTGSRSCFIGVKPHRHSGTPVDDGRVFTVRP